MDEEPYNLATWLALRAASQRGIRSIFFTWQNLKRTYPWPFRHFEQANYRRARHAIAGNPTSAEVLRAKGYAGPDQRHRPVRCRPGPLFATARCNQQSTPRHCDRIRGASCPGERRPCTPGGLRAAPAKHLVAPYPGRRAERLALEKLADNLGISGRVEFLGRLPSGETPRYYRQLDVLVLPSLSRPNWVEQFGRVLIEAMACGVPVVGSASGEIPWVIGDAGVLFPEGETAALAQTLGDLIDNAERRRELGMRGRERVLANFTQAQIAEATARVYASV